VRLAPLSLPDPALTSLDEVAAGPAVALYCDRAQAVDEKFRLETGNVRAVAALCRELDRNRASRPRTGSSTGSLPIAAKLYVYPLNELIPSTSPGRRPPLIPV
jgi:hypothetical protein